MNIKNVPNYKDTYWGISVLSNPGSDYLVERMVISERNFATDIFVDLSWRGQMRLFG